MNDELDTQLKELCDQHGWSYLGARTLVEQLFKSIAIRDATVREVRGELTRFRIDIENALGDSYEQNRDVVDSVKKLARERGRQWTTLLQEMRSDDKHTRRAAYRIVAAAFVGTAAHHAFNAGVEFRDRLENIWKKL